MVVRKISAFIYLWKNEEYKMTENKRFLIDDAGELIDLNNHKFIDYGDECCKLLNNLSDENEQLRKENDMLSCELSVSVNKEISRNCRITELEEENKQLKQFKEDVFNKIDMHLRMLPTVRDNEFNEEYGNPSLYTGAIYILETLKKELKE